jgi:hypothetical protein
MLKHAHPIAMAYICDTYVSNTIHRRYKRGMPNTSYDSRVDHSAPLAYQPLSRFIVTIAPIARVRVAAGSVLSCARRTPTISYSWSEAALGPVPMPWFALCWFAMRGCCKPSAMCSQGGKSRRAPERAVNHVEALSVSRGLSSSLRSLVDCSPQRCDCQYRLTLVHPAMTTRFISSTTPLRKIRHRGWTQLHLHETIDE